MNNSVLAITCILSLVGAYITADSGGGINFVPRLEGGMKGPVGFGIIVLIQALFGGQGFTDTPSAVTKLFKNDFFKFAALYIIVFSGTQDIEESFFILVAFLTTMQLLRTTKERKEHPYLI
jgi:hypothetical protein